MSLIGEIRSDIKNHGGVGVLKSTVVFFLDARFRVLLNFRIGKKLYDTNNALLKLIAKYYAYKLITKRSCQISYKSQIGSKVKFMHPLGVVIGDDVIVKDNVRIWQQVTLGSHGKPGSVLDYPIVEDGVRIYAGAKIIGGVRIGMNSVIGANSVVNRDVNEADTVVGIPAKSINRRN